MGVNFEDYVHVLRLALEGRADDVAALARKNFKKILREKPEHGEIIRRALSKFEDNQTVTRNLKQQPLPIDVDSKLELLKKEEGDLLLEPTWPEDVLLNLSSVVKERAHEQELLENGLSPTRSILFVGPPGVGKTLAAHWLSSELNRPLLTLDLAAVMSSYLGKTGNNIRAVLNYAQLSPSVLLLDEFDAIAKKRNDDSEVGELKRLVTVLLQAIDDWPSTGILIAATNHPELLDPAVWRRFERVVHFPVPSASEIESMIGKLLNNLSEYELRLVEVLSYVLEGNSFAEVVRLINSVRRDNIILKKDISFLLEELIMIRCKDLPRDKKVNIAKTLQNLGLSQRRISDLIGISRDTLRKYIKTEINK